MENVSEKWACPTNLAQGFLGILSGVDNTPAPAEVDLLGCTPLAGVLVGYGRVSTREQNLARQQAALSAARSASSTRRPARTPTGPS